MNRIIFISDINGNEDVVSYLKQSLERCYKNDFNFSFVQSNSFAKRFIRSTLKSYGKSDVVIVYSRLLSFPLINKLKEKNNFKLIYVIDNTRISKCCLGLALKRELQYANGIIYDSDESKNILNLERPDFVIGVSNKFAAFFNQILSSKRFMLINNSYGGSTGNLVRSIHNYLLSCGHDSRFYYLLGDKYTDYGCFRYGSKLEHYCSALFTRITGNCYGYMRFSTCSLLKKTKCYEPDLVNAHCINSYSINIREYLSYLKNHNIQVLLTNHALFFATGTCGYPYGECNRYLVGCGNCPNKKYSCKSIIKDRTKKNWEEMKALFEDSKFYMSSVSGYVKSICASSPISKSLYNRVILNGIDVSNFHFRNNKFNNGKTNIAYLALDSKNSNKGFSNFVKILERFKGRDDIVFHVVGEKNEILKQYNNVIMHGYLPDKNKLSELYSSCDLYLITSRKETFSLPVVESLCSGTPVAGYKCGGPESFVDQHYTALFEYQDIDGLCSYISSKSYLSIDKAKLSKESRDVYSMHSMNEQYLSFYLDIINERI